MDQQNQNPAPDYGFILSKPAPPVKKSLFSKRLMIGAGALMVILVGLAVVAALLPKNYNSQAAQTALSYYQAIGSKNYEGAYALLDAADSSKKEAFVSKIGPALQASYKLSACTTKGTVKKADSYVTSISCPFASSGAATVFEVQTARKNGTMKITGFVDTQGVAK